MRIEVTEDYPGEVLGFTDAELGDKLRGAFAGVAEQLLKARAKGDEGGGEVDALDELVAELDRGFAAELDRIRASLGS